MIECHENCMIEIAGKTYRIKCPKDKEGDLKASALLVEQEVNELAEKGKMVSVSDRHTVIIVALNLAYKLLIERRKTKNPNHTHLMQSIRLLKETLEKELASDH